MNGDNLGGIMNGVTIQENGSISADDARRIRKRLRLHIITDTRAMYDALEVVLQLCNKLMNEATIEFAVEDLTDPDKEF